MKKFTDYLATLESSEHIQKSNYSMLVAASLAPLKINLAAKAQ